MLRPDFVRWRDDVFLATIARLLVDRGADGRDEAKDLHRALGEVLGLDSARGGARVREFWQRCPKKDVATCPTCSSFDAPLGHGPYLKRKEGKRWVTVEETDDQRKMRRARALARHAIVAHEHAELLLATTAGAPAEGFLEGEAAEEAAAEIRRHLIS